MPLLTRPSIDWKAPDYDAIFQQRLAVLDGIRSQPPNEQKAIIADMRDVYRELPAQFITDWGVTIDPRNLEIGLPAVVPFVLFDKQVEWIDWVLDCWHSRSRINITEKSRDMGITWCAAALAGTLCTFMDDMAIGFGSRKAELVDNLGDPKSILYKVREFLKYLPREFRPVWTSKEMQVDFPERRGVIAGEAGDDIGRGDRKALYLVDEAAHLEHPEAVDAALSNTTNCRIELSSVKGMDNPFAQRRHSGKHRVFTFHWRHDPRKDDAWYQSMMDELDPVVLAQEVDINYSASVEGVVIPSLWVQAAIDACDKLRIIPTGVRSGSLDVAGGGIDGRSIDKNAFASRYGVELQHIEEWPGQDAGDIFASVERTFLLCDNEGLELFDYDADGLGAAVPGDARVINERRRAEYESSHEFLTSVMPAYQPITARPFRGSASGEALFQPEAFVLGPDGKPTQRKNKDFFANYKAQSWWALRYRFQQTYRAVVKGMKVDPDTIISIPSRLKDLRPWARMLMELSQPTYAINGAGKLVIDKQPDGVPSPNCGDAVMMLFAPRRAALSISDELLKTA